MPSNMSFSLTKPQVRAQEKDVTRRLGWWNLEPGDVLWAVEKAMGLKKGEHVKRLALIRVVKVHSEPLLRIKQNTHRGPYKALTEVFREGFAGWSAQAFIEFFCRTHHCKPTTRVNRIEFEYVTPKRRGR